MGKINLDKVNGFEPIKPERQAEVKAVQNSPVKPERSGLQTNKDSVSFSGKAAEVGKLVNELKQLPDVRAERVEEVRTKLELGDFAPSAREIVDAIVEEEKGK